jgi:hypothetical protein
MTPVAEIERAALRVCFGAEATATDLQMLGDERVWRVYREMARKRLREECQLGLKRTLAAAGEVAFERAFVAHLAEDPPRVRYFRGIVPAFARSAAPRFRADPTVPPYAADLCAWEGALWEVGDLDDRAPGPAPVEFGFDRAPVLAPALRLLHFAHAVHEAPDASGAYAARETYLCVHRRAEDRAPRTWTLDPVMHALMVRFERGTEPIAAAIQAVAQARGISVDGHFVDGLCTVLADFLERGVILGSR